MAMCILAFAVFTPFGVLANGPSGETEAVHEVIVASPEAADQGARVHRLESARRSLFDAFVYVNRIPVEPEEEETADDLSGRILGRLANQEGRVLIKLPPEMTRQAYRGFKVALESDEQSHAGRCFACHRLPDMGDATLSNRVPSLRNRVASKPKSFATVARDSVHAKIAIDASDVTDLDAFLQLLADTSDSEFRQLIIDARVVDVLGDAE